MVKRKRTEKKTLKELGFPHKVEQQVFELVNGADDDPPLVGDWNMDDVGRFLGNIGNYKGPHQCPFPLTLPLTPDAFVEALLDHWRAGAGAGMPARIGHVCLPASAPKLATLVGFVVHDATNPW